MADKEIRIRLSGDANALVGSIKLTDEQINKLDKSAKQVNRSAGGFRQTADRLRSSLLSVQSVVVGLASGALVSMYKRSIDNADALAKTADSLGISTDAYQEYRFAADRAGVDTQTFSMAMQSAEKVIGNAKQGTGQLITYLKLYDPVMLSNIQHTKTMDQALQLLFKGMADAKSSTDAAALSAAVFGTTAGVKMVNLIKGGTEALDAMRQKAHDLGIVIDESVLRNAERAKDQLTDLSYVLSSQLTQAMVDLAPIANSVAYALQKDAQWAGEFADRFRDINNVTHLGPLLDQMDKLREKQQELQAELKSEQTGPLSRSFFAKLLGITPDKTRKELQDVESQMEAVSKRIYELKKIQAPQSKSGLLGGSATDLAASKSLVDSLTKSLRNQAETYGLSSTMALRYRIQQGDVNDALKALGPAGEKARTQLLAYVNALALQDQKAKDTAASMKRLNQMTAEGDRIYEQTRTPAEKYIHDLMHLEDLLTSGDISPNTFYRQWNKESKDFLAQQTGIAINWGNVWANTLTNFSQGVGDTIGRAIVESQSLAEGFKATMRGVAEQIISSLIQIGIQRAVLWALEKANLASTTAASVVAGTTTAAAWAPAAAAVNAATFGAGAYAADVALTSTYGLTKSLSLSGVAHDGIDYVPREGTWLLNKGERVISPQDNLALTKALQSGQMGGQTVHVPQQFVFQAADAQGMDRVIAKYMPAIQAAAVQGVQRAYNARGQRGPLG